MPPKDWRDRFWDASSGQLTKFIAQDFANTLWACGHLSLTPPESWLQRYWAESEGKLLQFNAQNLSNTLFACGKLSLTPPEDWLESYLACCAAALARFNGQDFSNTLYACCQLQLLQHPVAAKVWTAAMEMVSAPGWAPRDADLCLCQLYHVSKLAEAELPGSCFSFPDAALIERAKAAWHALQSGGSAQAATSFELQVSSCLTRLGVAHQRSFLCTDCEHTIDVAITAGGKRLAIEVDGPTHFLQAPQHTLDGSTLSIGGNQVRDLGIGEAFYVQFSTLTALASAGASTVTFQIVHADDAALSTNLEIIAQTGALAKTALTLPYLQPVSKMTSRCCLGVS
jgi:hypothetical protein